MAFFRPRRLLFAILTAGVFVGCSPKDPTAVSPDIAVVQIQTKSPDHPASTKCRGFLVSADGLVVTCLHFIDGAQDITVVRGNGDKLFADFVQGDKEADLAILRVHGRDLPFLKLFTDDVEPGMHVRLIGTGGTIHGVFDHWEDFGKALDVTVAMLPIDYGSPLLGDDGRVLAVARGPTKEKAGESIATPIFRVLKMMPGISQ